MKQDNKKTTIFNYPAKNTAVMYIEILLNTKEKH